MDMRQAHVLRDNQAALAGISDGAKFDEAAQWLRFRRTHEARVKGLAQLLDRIANLEAQLAAVSAKGDKR